MTSILNSSSLTLTQITDQFGRKRCQQKRKDVSYQLLSEFFQKYFVANEWSAIKNMFRTYVCSKIDSFFCEVLYLCETYLRFCDSFNHYSRIKRDKNGVKHLKFYMVILDKLGLHCRVSLCSA